MSDKTNKLDKPTLDYLAEAGAKGTAVDLEKLPLKLIILCQSKKKLDSTGTYLNRRGWETAIITDVKELFKWIASFKPDFLLLSVNHPSPKLEKLPQVVYQTFKLQSITFGELSDTRTMKMMQTVQAAHKITGSISGPSAHRRIKNLLQEIYQPPKTAVDPSGGVKEFSGKGQDVGKELSQGEKEDQGVFYFKSAQDKQTDADAFMIAKGEAGTEASGKIGSQPLSDRSSAASGSEIDLDALAKEFAPVSKKTGSSAPISEKKLKEMLKESDLASKEFQAPIFEANLSKEVSDSTSANLESSAQNHSPFADLKALTQESGAQKQENLNSNYDHERSTKERMTSNESNLPQYGSEDRTREKKVSAEEEMYKGKLTFESIIRRAAIAAAQKKSENHQEITTATEAFAIPITMTGKRGIIVIAQNGSTKDRVVFESKFLNELGMYLQAAGEEAMLDQPLRLTFDLVEVRIVDGEGIISFKIPNNDGDALITFVEEEVAGPQTKRSAAGKTEVSIHDIVEDVPVGAAVYLHLPKNDRYYRIVSTTAAMSLGQKKRIIAAKAAVYLDTETVPTFVDTSKRNKSIARIKGSWTKKKAS